MHPPNDARIEFAVDQINENAQRQRRHGYRRPLRHVHPFGHGERIGGLRQRQYYVGIEGHQSLLSA